MKKISVIFFLLCLVLIFIYNKYNFKNLDILYLGDDEIYYKHIFDLKSNKYTYDNISYKDIVNEIKSNSFKIIKNKNVYLNQLISSSDVILLSANNFEYKNKCKKIDRIINEYDILISDELNKLIPIINKISDAKIFVIGNSCDNKNHIQSLDLLDGYYVNYENIDNLDKIIMKYVNN